jgi:DNA polymerase-3 subunit gamma/tau
MAYQVLARKWRPQRFEDVVGQRAVTQTLRNAITSGRLAHAFVFAGPRGVGKTTTARILARALNCVEKPSADPCGRCDACVEIAEGRDIDVLEIDAATHTGVDNVREVIIAGLAIRPVRDRYKVFVIDEVHQLSASSFNALLKSIEEPPPHVVFIMATTELEKIPETITSRAQVFEFKTIPSKAIADQLRAIARAESIEVSDEALGLIARAAGGSMRDAQTAFDQVIAFAGTTIAVEDVSSVLGLVGRDLLLNVVTAVADEHASAAFDLAGTAVASGYDLRLVVRELSRVVRDLLIIGIDPSRLNDPEIAPEGERDRLKSLSSRFSREDLLRAFDLLARAESDIRGAAEPRFHLEMALVRWMHLRKLLPLSEILEGLQKGQLPARATAPAPTATLPPEAGSHKNPAAASSPPTPVDTIKEAATSTSDRDDGSGFKQALLADVQRSRAVFYNTAIAQAQRIEFDGQRIVFAFAPNHRMLREQVDQHRAWLESIAQRLTGGRKISVVTESSASVEAAAPASAPPPPSDLKSRALADAGVQAMLDVFPVEIKDIEELE